MGLLFKPERRPRTLQSPFCLYWCCYYLLYCSPCCCYILDEDMFYSWPFETHWITMLLSKSRLGLYQNTLYSFSPRPLGESFFLVAQERTVDLCHSSFAWKSVAWSPSLCFIICMFICLLSSQWVKWYVLAIKKKWHHAHSGTRRAALMNGG